jgi:hypothetical protein
MMDQPRFHAALEQRHVQCVEHQLLINPFTHPPAKISQRAGAGGEQSGGYTSMTCPKGDKSVETLKNPPAARNVMTVIR